MKRPPSPRGSDRPRNAARKVDNPKPGKTRQSRSGSGFRNRKTKNAGGEVIAFLSRSQSAIRADFSGRSRFTRVLIRSLAAAVLSLILVVAVAVFSPLLAVEKIVVKGTTAAIQKKIIKTLDSEIGKPLPQINSENIAKLLQPYKQIESFTLVSLPPHTLVVRIVERTPIAIVYVGDNFHYFDPAGVNLGTATNTSKLPVLDIKGVPGKSENFKVAISVLLALPADLLPKIALLSAKSTDNVSFRLRGYSAQRVLWGNSSNSILKSRVLAALIKNQSPNDRVTYDVSSPTAPTVRYQ